MVFNEQQFTMRSARPGGPDAGFVEPVHGPVNDDHVFSNDVQKPQSHKPPGHHHFGPDIRSPPSRPGPGESVHFGCLRRSGGQVTKAGTCADLATLSFAKFDPVTGPICINGAKPGDALKIQIGGVVPSGWGWTAPFPGFGLLAARFEASARAMALPEDVHIAAAETRLRRIRHELSGGTRQRVMIAMARACSSEILIADEPTTALDVTVQAEQPTLIRVLQRDHGTTVLMIAPVIGVAAEGADRVPLVQIAPGHWVAGARPGPDRAEAGRRKRRPDEELGNGFAVLLRRNRQ